MVQIAVTYVDHMGSDLSVVNSARVSFGKVSRPKVEFEWSDEESAFILKESLNRRDTKLIKYLARHKHMSPFGHAFASFHVKAPIFVARQLVKHKFLRWNETSRRYVDDTPEFFLPEVWRGRSEDKKQGSSGEVSWGENWDDSCYIPEKISAECLATYQHLLEQGVAPEQARMVLPQNTMTEWYWSGSLDAFADMAKLRLKSDTQEETRVVAQGISDKMQELFPVSWKELVQYEG